MNLSGQLLFFFSALGAFNGLLLTLYLFFSRPADIERRLLAGMLLAISLRISKSIWYFFDPNIGKQFLQLGLSACFMIGPLLFLYVASATKRLDAMRPAWSVQLVFLLMLITVVGIVYPYQVYPALWGGLFYKLINWSWGLYIVAALYLLYPALKDAYQGRKKLKSNEVLASNALAGTTLIWLAYFTSSYTSYIVGALSFSFVLYLTLLVRLFNRKEKSDAPYADKKIDAKAESDISGRLQAVMSGEQLYKNANLTLPVLAKKVRVSVPQLSQLLNDNLNLSFATYINSLRIEEAKRLLLDEPNMTMEMIAEASGYNSQSTFYTAFKQFENITPAKYRKAHQKSASETPDL